MTGVTFAYDRSLAEACPSPPFARYFSLLAILKIALAIGHGMGYNSPRFGLARAGADRLPAQAAASNRSRRMALRIREAISNWTEISK